MDRIFISVYGLFLYIICAIVPSKALAENCNARCQVWSGAANGKCEAEFISYENKCRQLAQQRTDACVTKQIWQRGRLCSRLYARYVSQCAQILAKQQMRCDARYQNCLQRLSDYCVVFCIKHKEQANCYERCRKSKVANCADIHRGCVGPLTVKHKTCLHNAGRERQLCYAKIGDNVQRCAANAQRAMITFQTRINLRLAACHKNSNKALSLCQRSCNFTNGKVKK